MCVRVCGKLLGIENLIFVNLVYILLKLLGLEFIKFIL